MNLGLSDISLTRMQGALAPVFAAGLRTSMVADVAPAGVGGITFARATTGYVRDHDGVLRTAAANEPRFLGARRVGNKVTNSVNLAVSFVITLGGTGVGATMTGGQPAPDGTLTAFRIQADRGAGTTVADYAGFRNNVSCNLRSVWVRSNSGTNQTFSFYRPDSGAVVIATPEWRRVHQCHGFSGGVMDLFAVGPADQQIDITVWHPQAEDTLGAAVQTPGEYVSVGELSAPWHGAGIDGVKYFNTVRLHTQNLLDNPESFLAGTWTQAGVNAPVPNSATAPDGSQTGCFLSENTSSGQHYLSRESVAKDAGSIPMAFSVYAKAGGRNELFLILRGLSGISVAQASFLLNAGVVGSPALTGGSFVYGTAAATIEDAGNGWYRCTLSATTDTAAVVSARLVLGDGGGLNNYTGNGASGVYVWHPQVRMNAASVLPAYVNGGAASITTDTGETAAIPASTLLGYLSEPQATNLALQSRFFANAGWAKTDIAVGPSDNSQVAPSGEGSSSTTASTWTEGAAGTASLSATSSSFAAGTTLTYSVYLKRGASATQDWVRLRMTNAGGTDGAQGWFNLATGAKGAVTTIGVAANVASAIEAAGNGWFRCSVTCQIDPATTTAAILFIMSATGDGSTTRVNAAVFIGWGVQVEAGKSASSPIITTTAPVTRNGDQLSPPAALWTADLQAQGSLYAEVTKTMGGALSYVMQIAGATAGTPMYVTDTGIEQMSDGTNYPVAPGTMAVGIQYKCASNWGGSATRVFRDGAAGTAGGFDGAMATVPTAIGIGWNTGSYQLGGTIRNLRIYGQKLPDNELQAMTA